MTTTALGWLEPPVVDVPDGVRLADVGPVGWQVLLRDGVLEPVRGEVAAVRGRPPDPAVRAGALRELVPPRAVVGRAAAVWVHTGGPAPARFDVLVAPRVRRPSPHPLRVPHESPLPPADVLRLGEVRVTTVQRTALDVARWLAPEVAEPLLDRLVTDTGLDPYAPLRLLDLARGHVRGPAARAVLEGWLARRRSGGQEVPAGTPAAFEPVIR